MALTFGSSSKHKPTVIYKNHIYNKHRANQKGYITWRCQEYQRHKCHAQLVTKENQMVSNPAPVHTHGIVNFTEHASALENARAEKTAMEISQQPDFTKKTHNDERRNNEISSMKFKDNELSNQTSGEEDEEDEEELIKQLYDALSQYAKSIDIKTS